MFKRFQFIQTCFAITVVGMGILVFYAVIWEPYCFFSKPIDSDDIVSLATSKIHSYRPSNSSSDTKDLILVLVPRVSSKLIVRLKYMDLNFADNFSTSLLLMHNGNLYESDFIRLTKIIRRPVLFLDIGIYFNLFPKGFDPCQTRTSYRVRGKWNYLQMIRFWFKILFELPQLREYDYIMRLDDDSRLRNRWFNVFDEMRAKNAVYFANNEDIDLEERLPGTMKLKDVTFDYIERNKIKPKQLEMLRNTFGDKVVRNYYNNFEVIKMEFFRQNQIRQWVETIDSTNGIFYYRWGDAIFRYLTLAIFAEKHQVLHRSDYNLSYCHKC